MNQKRWIKRCWIIHLTHEYCVIWVWSYLWIQLEGLKVCPSVRCGVRKRKIGDYQANPHTPRTHQGYGKQWDIYICGCGFSEAKSCKHTYPCQLTVVFYPLNISEQFSYQLAQHVRGKRYVSLPYVPVNHFMAISIHLTMRSPISEALVYLLSTLGVQVCNKAQVLNITTMARHITRHDMYVF